MGKELVFNVKLDNANTDSKTLKRYIDYCSLNKITNAKLVQMALDCFFRDRKNQLMSLDKEQLIDIITKMESEEK